MGLVKVTLDSDAHIHLKRFIKFLRRQDNLDPSVGVMLHNPDLWSEQQIIDLYLKWLEDGEPEE